MQDPCDEDSVKTHESRNPMKDPSEMLAEEEASRVKKKKNEKKKKKRPNKERNNTRKNQGAMTDTVCMEAGDKSSDAENTWCRHEGT